MLHFGDCGTRSRWTVGPRGGFRKPEGCGCFRSVLNVMGVEYQRGKPALSATTDAAGFVRFLGAETRWRVGMWDKPTRVAGSWKAQTSSALLRIWEGDIELHGNREYHLRNLSMSVGSSRPDGPGLSAASMRKSGSAGNPCDSHPSLSGCVPIIRTPSRGGRSLCYVWALEQSRRIQNLPTRQRLLAAS